jgi:hypothetical protein
VDITKILAQWEQDGKIDKSALDSTTIDCAILHARYLELYTKSKLLVKKAEAEAARLQLNKYLWYTGKMTKADMDKHGWSYDPYNGLTKPLKSELEMWMNADPDIEKMNLKLAVAKETTAALKEILDTLRWRNQSIKNIIDWRKFQAGS